MRITEVSRWVIDGREFPTKRAAMEHESNLLGALIDSHLLQGIMFGPGDRLKLHENIMKSRHALLRILEDDHDTEED